MTGARPPPREEFWALRDIDFDIARGEAVGIIGRNGAGKSTLLKILSRITAPTAGEVRLRGRVASLLEVGTGFHPELTGRENIFLNGAIMGMKRAEIRAQFDAIVAFADVDRFLDTPVKYYSTGMHVRLAFAVAAHLRPEILLIDEVLAVGDGAFQKKCMGKIEDVASGGRSVLFVSHNLAAVARLCSRAILLHEGRVVASGPVPSVLAEYVGGATGHSPTYVDFRRGSRSLPGSEDARLLAARVSSQGMTAASADIRRPVHLEIDFEVLQARMAVHAIAQLHDEFGHCLFTTMDCLDAESRAPRPPGCYRAIVEIPGNFLTEGWLSVDIGLWSHEPVAVHAHERGLLSFQVIDASEGDGARGNYVGPLPGVIRPTLAWHTQRISS